MTALEGPYRSLTDWDLHHLTRRRLAEQPETSQARVAQIADLRALAAEIRSRTPNATSWPS